MGIVAKMMNESTEFCRLYLDNTNFRIAINDRVFQQVYKNIQNSSM